MRVLVVEDDRDLRTALKACLESASFAVDVAEDGSVGSFMARTNDYDAILLDLFLPGRNGRAVCTDLRVAGKHAPILIMTVESEVTNRVELLNLGADDFLAKPFSFDELVARVRALVRRPRALQKDVLEYRHLKLDVPRQQVWVRSKAVYLTRKEFVLLEYLMRNQGIVVTRHMLLEHVWDGALDMFTNTIETHIRSLRKKVELKTLPKLIHTIPGRGYVFDTR